MMTAPHSETLPYPNEMPEGYVSLSNEPVFDPLVHLDLGQPEEIVLLQELGYSEHEIGQCASSFGVCSAFKVLSEEGVLVMRELCEKMYSNRNASTGTGVNRLGSYIRGAGYRSKFVRDFCNSPELAEHLSKLTKVPLARHSVPAVACGINYAPEDINRGVDSWHVDSVAFDIVMMVSDPQSFTGGKFQYFHGTKMQGQKLLGIEGEEGIEDELPEHSVTTVNFPAAGYAFLQQGSMIFHRATKLLQRAERITMIPAFVVAPATSNDSTNSVNMLDWEDPGIAPELTRHEVWRASARLQSLIDQVSLCEDKATLTKRIDQALEPLLAFRNKLSEQE